MYVVDSNRNRVLAWNNIGTSSNAAPDIVLGQTSFTTSTANNGGISASTFSYPYGVFCDGTRLFVTDYGNNRVLIWTSLPTVSGQAANIVVGQSNMTSSTSGTTSTTLYGPMGIWSTGSVLYVADSNNNRVLKYNTIPGANGAAASIVLGQMNLSSGASGCAASSLQHPTNVTVTGTKVMVTDLYNHRVMIWNAIPGSNGLPADVVVGAPDAVTCTGNTTSSTFQYPNDIATDGTKLYISDQYNHRIMVYNSIPTSHGQAASSVYGQADFTSSNPNGIVTGNPRGNLSASTLYTPMGLHLNSGYLYISDFGNQRLLAVPAP
jgi:hypothetical protein